MRVGQGLVALAVGRRGDGKGVLADARDEGDVDELDLALEARGVVDDVEPADQLGAGRARGVSGRTGRGRRRPAKRTDVVVRLIRQVADYAEEALEDRAARLAAGGARPKQSGVLEDDEHPAQAGRRGLEPPLRSAQKALQPSDDGEAELGRQGRQKQIEALQLVHVDAGLRPRRREALRKGGQAGRVSAGTAPGRMRTCDARC